jgi:hypothetical protein
MKDCSRMHDASMLACDMCAVYSPVCIWLDAFMVKLHSFGGGPTGYVVYAMAYPEAARLLR